MLVFHAAPSALARVCRSLVANGGTPGTQNCRAPKCPVPSYHLYDTRTVPSTVGYVANRDTSVWSGRRLGAVADGARADERAALYTLRRQIGCDSRFSSAPFAAGCAMIPPSGLAMVGLSDSG